MSLMARLTGKRLVHSSTGDYNDGWSVSTIMFLLYEDRWGGRSYQVRGPAGVPKTARFRLLEEPVQIWLQGGQLPPLRLDAVVRGPQGRDGHVQGMLPTPGESLSRADRERLAKFLSLLDSRHDGEVLNAAKAAGDLLRSRQASWAEAVGVPPQGPRP